jgi:hypothetical protein
MLNTHKQKGAADATRAHKAQTEARLGTDPSFATQSEGIVLQNFFDANREP